MKKILPGLVLISLLAVLVLPLAVSAQDEPIQCCKIRKTVEIDNEKCLQGEIAGPENGTCPSALGGTVPTCPNGSGAVGSEKWGIFCLINTVNTVVDWFFAVLVAVSVLLAIIGAFQILTAGASPEKISAGRGYILYAAVGLAIAFIARAVPSLVKAVMGF